MCVWPFHSVFNGWIPGCRNLVLHSCMHWICSAVDEACVVGPLLDTVLSIVCALESPRATSCGAVLYQPFCKVAGEVNLLV